MEVLNINKYSKIIVNKWKIIVYFLIAFLILGVIYSVLFYKPRYKSTAKLMLMNKETTNFVTNLGAQNPNLSGITNKSNPIFTQLQIITSNDLSENVLKKLNNQIDIGNYPEKIKALILKSGLNIDNPPGTDVINVAYTWDTSENAQKILQEYIAVYIEQNISFNNQSVRQAGKYISNQLKNSTNDLELVRSEIKNYRKTNQSIAIEQEAASMIVQITQTEDHIAQIEGELSAEISASKELSNKIDMDVKDAINSVALGQNDNLLSLQKDLQRAEQSYSLLFSKYPATNPKVQSVSKQIDKIKKQIKKQITNTIGNKINGSIISDPLRTKIVDKLIDSQIQINSLQAKKDSLTATLKDLKLKVNNIPDKQATLSTLLQKERTLAQVVRTLTEKLIEAKIKESEIVSNIKVIQNPTLTYNESFPTAYHLIILFSLIGTLIGFTFVIGMHFVEDTIEGAQELEDLLGVPVFGVIPWLTKSNFVETLEAYNADSLVGIIYQKISTTFKIICVKKKAKVIGFTSADLEKKRSFVISNIAKGLATLGHSVVLVDADLRVSTLSNEFNIENIDKSKYLNISKVLTSIKVGQVDKMIMNSLIPLDSNNKVFLLSAPDNVDDPYKVLVNNEFKLLISKLKENFDFVLVDTPPILAVPDLLGISDVLDAVTVVSGLKTSRSKLRTVLKLCKENYIDIIGAVTRDDTSELNIPESIYIKQLALDPDSENADSLDEKDLQNI